MAGRSAFRGLVVFGLCLLSLSLPSSVFGQELQDFTKSTPESLGIKAVPEKKDAKTGFVSGGKNATELILKLEEINGRSIANLEKDMRPGAQSEVGSTKGFLGPKEKLLEVMAADNKLVVEEWGLTHQELAKHLHMIGVISEKTNGAEFRYHGRRYRAEAQFFLGFQPSPFYDGTKTSGDVYLVNLDNGKKISYSLLVPHMIERYGFYEGKGTPYRVEPAQVVAVFDFLKKPAKPRP